MLFNVVLFLALPPFVLLLMLLLVPGHYRSLALRISNTFLFTKMGGKLPYPLIRIVLFFLLCVFAGSLYSVAKEGTPRPSVNAPYEQTLNYHAKNWRVQRNCYLSALSATLWWFLYSVHNLLSKLVASEYTTTVNNTKTEQEQSRALSTGGTPATSSGTPATSKKDL